MIWASGVGSWSESRHSTSPQVNRLTCEDGPDMWQVMPITDTWDFVAKMLEIHDTHAARQWQEFDMEERMAVSGSMDDVLCGTPPSDMGLT